MGATHGLKGGRALPLHSSPSCSWHLLEKAGARDLSESGSILSHPALEPDILTKHVDPPVVLSL